MDRSNDGSTTGIPNRVGGPRILGLSPAELSIVFEAGNQCRSKLLSVGMAGVPWGCRRVVIGSCVGAAEGEYPDYLLLLPLEK